MANNIAQLKTLNGQPLNPKTKTGAVTNDNNVDLDTLLAQKASLSDLGIPIYTQQQLDNLSAIPSDYLTIPSDSDLNGSLSGTTYTTTVNGNYVDIMFKAIRALQTEVAKLRNSFVYGINSYTGTDTAMSAVTDSIEEPEQEPIWAVDESELSAMTDEDIEFNENYSKKLISLEGDVDSSVFKQLKINGTAYWQQYALNSQPDAKTFLYLNTTRETTGLGLKFYFKNSDDQTSVIDLDDLGIPSVNTYNILLVIDKKVNEFGHNSIYLTIDNRQTDHNIFEKYIDFNKNTSDSPIELDDIYFLNQVDFKDLVLTKFNIYTKFQDFTNHITPKKPSQEDYKYKVAHLTIRSVSNKDEMMSISNYLQTNELIYDENTSYLWIKTSEGLKRVSGAAGGSDDDDNNDNIMTKEQLQIMLNQLGITDINNNLNIGELEKLSLKHTGSGTTYSFEVDENGGFRTITEVPENKKMENLLNKNNLIKNSYQAFQDRGFASFFFNGSSYGTVSNPLNTDRVVISQIYFPLDSDIRNNKIGCTHGFIELANTSDKDFPLDGTYIYYHSSNDKNDKTKGITRRLALSGKVPANSTYLIRCKKFANPEDSGVWINVDDYDIEWYGEISQNSGAWTKAADILDTTLSSTAPGAETETYPFIELALVYNTPYYKEKAEGSDQYYSLVENFNHNEVVLNDTKVTQFLIDTISLSTNSGAKDGLNWCTRDIITNKSNSIIKCTFSLDPAKQAYQGLNKNDSARVRWAKVTNDYWVMDINSECVTVRTTNEKYPVSRYTPRSSRYSKNVCSDKTPFDKTRPNAVTVSFGKNMLTTRCFNWVSSGHSGLDEYVWIQKSDTYDFESTTFGRYMSYSTTTDWFGGDNQLGNIEKKSFADNIKTAVYNRQTHKFPGSGDMYTCHKCILTSITTPTTTPEKYSYVVGKARPDGTPDPERCSKSMNFTMYPASYTPKVYQVTDQQGFHWIEYQVWAGVAKKLNSKIKEDQQLTPNIIPVLINTGDMTQSGCRVNEWLDYYNAGSCLFDHLEQMNVVGNNDLSSSTDVEELGTGDDNGKSNSFFFHMFYCYEVETEGVKVPIVNNKYVPSQYMFGNGTWNFLMLNSELTMVTCRDWYNIGDYNIYTGYRFDIDTSATANYRQEDWTPLYNMIYAMINEVAEANRSKIIAVCHEMPFTVTTITNLFIKNKTELSRSYDNGGNGLVGSHLNQINENLNEYGAFWFSRLMESFGIKLVIGGHKHTYCITHPIKEYFTWQEGSVTKNSLSDNYTMPESLDDPKEKSIKWVQDMYYNWTKGIFEKTIDGSSEYIYETDDKGTLGKAVNPSSPKIYKVHTSKLPIINFDVLSKVKIDNKAISNVVQNNIFGDSQFLPYTYKNGMTGGVIYYMCQASGYKLTSNKELPSSRQAYSCLIPKTNNTYTEATKKWEDKPSNEQKRPMFTEIVLGSDIKVYLIRVAGIMDNGTALSGAFTQASNYNNPTLQYIAEKSSEGNLYGTWGETRVPVLTITL